MKTAIVFFCFLGLAYCNLTAEQMEHVKKTAQECQASTGATDADMAGVLQHQVPDSKEGQCFVACVSKKFGAMSADNKMDVDRIKEIAEPFKAKDPENYEKMMKVAETCSSQAASDADECVAAKNMMECCIKESAAIGLKMSPMDMM